MATPRGGAHFAAGNPTDEKTERPLVSNSTVSLAAQPEKGTKAYYLAIIKKQNKGKEEATVEADKAANDTLAQRFEDLNSFVTTVTTVEEKKKDQLKDKKKNKEWIDALEKFRLFELSVKDPHALDEDFKQKILHDFVSKFKKIAQDSSLITNEMRIKIRAVVVTHESIFDTRAEISKSREVDQPKESEEKEDGPTNIIPLAEEKTEKQNGAVADGSIISGSPQPEERNKEYYRRMMEEHYKDDMISGSFEQENKAEMFFNLYSFIKKVHDGKNEYGSLNSGKYNKAVCDHLARFSDFEDRFANPEYPLESSLKKEIDYFVLEFKKIFNDSENHVAPKTREKIEWMLGNNKRHFDLREERLKNPPKEASERKKDGEGNFNTEEKEYSIIPPAPHSKEFLNEKIPPSDQQQNQTIKTQQEENNSVQGSREPLVVERNKPLEASTPPEESAVNPSKKKLFESFKTELNNCKTIDDFYNLFKSLNGKHAYPNENKFHELKIEKGFHRYFQKYGKTKTYQYAMKLLKEKAMELYEKQIENSEITKLDLQTGRRSLLNNEEKFTEIFNTHRHRLNFGGNTKTEREHQQKKKPQH